MKQDRRKSAKIKKPGKPYPDFPLFPHATGRWAKKIKGKLHYFGPWDDPQAALDKFNEQKDDLYAGRTPRVSKTGVTIRDLLNAFLTSKKRVLDSNEISQRTFSDYYQTCERIKQAFGLTRLVADLAADDFEDFRASMARKWPSPVTLANEIQRIRVVFKYAFDQGLIEHPVRYGQGFKRPSKKNLRKHRNAGEKKFFEADEIRKLLGVASVQMKAMILLGINCGFGNTDCGTLPQSALDLEGGWIDFPRPKTGIVRRCPLWSETVEALRAAIAKRPQAKHKADAGLVFVTRYGEPWAKTKLTKGEPETEGDGGEGNSDEAEQSHEEVAKRRRALIDSPVTKEMSKLTTKLKIKRKGVSFYALRHTFETIGGESRDQVAVDAIMGHAKDDMASVYREGISDERLQGVVGVIHKWLFDEEQDNPNERKGQRGSPAGKAKARGKGEAVGKPKK